MSPLTIATIFGVVVLGWVIVSFNRFVSQRNLISNSWSNVETVRGYNRRLESIPSRFIAAVGRFAKANYFEIDEAARAPRSAKTV
jgi:hypothetical protein